MPAHHCLHAQLSQHALSATLRTSCQVLDLWVDSFNPEFIERSMAGVIRDLMLALWAHIQPHPNPHGTKVRTFGTLTMRRHLQSAHCHGPWQQRSEVALPCRWRKSWASWAGDRASGCLTAW